MNRIFAKVTTTGLQVYRGTRKTTKPFASDPGDFGRGIYYATRFHVAKHYGVVTKSVIKLSNPLILTVAEAYRLADFYQTVRLPDEEWRELWVTLRQIGRGHFLNAIQERQLQNAERFTRDMLAKGHDGLVVIHKHGYLEVVDYRPYFYVSREAKSVGGLQFS